MLTAVVAMLATSCVKDATDDIQVTGAEGLVTFTVEAPEFGSRTLIGNGQKATSLVYAVYDKNWEYLTEGAAQFQDLVANVSLRLVNNKEYNFVFWASVPGNTYYTLDTRTATVEVSYEGEANDENRDAFFGQLKGLVVDGTMNESVKLYRPFAQVNWGTNDVAEAKIGGFDITTAGTAVYEAEAYTSLSLKDGAVDGLTTVTFAANELVSNSYVDENGAAEQLVTKAGASYTWLAMNYLLWTADEGTLTYNKLTIEDNLGQKVVVSYPNANVRRNWRTNLVGSLLTDQTNIEVEIKPIFEGEYVGVVEVGTEEEFNAAFANLGVDFIVLSSDVTLTTTVTRAAALLAVSAGQKLTIDLNGQKLIANTPQLFDVLGTLVAKNGTIENTAGEVFVDTTNVTIANTTTIDSEDTIYYDAEGVGHTIVSTWDEFTTALAEGKPEVMFGADITCEKLYTLSKDVVIDLNGKTLALASSVDHFAIKANATIKNGKFNGKIYPQSGNVTLSGLAFGGALASSQVTQGVITTKGGNIVIEKCDMKNVTVASGKTKPRKVSIEGRSSGSVKLLDCDFSNFRLNNSYINSISGTASLEITKCKFGNTTNIETVKAYSLTNFVFSGNSGGFAFVAVGRNKADVTEAEEAHLQAMKSNNSGQLRVDYNDGSVKY